MAIEDIRYPEDYIHFRHKGEWFCVRIDEVPEIQAEAEAIINKLLENKENRA